MVQNCRCMVIKEGKAGNMAAEHYNDQTDEQRPLYMPGS